MIAHGNRRQRQIQIEDGTYVPVPRIEGALLPPSKGTVYGSLGLCLRAVMRGARR